jgi:pimeloyl-ACP methyl ester carboxylesterase
MIERKILVRGKSRRFYSTLTLPNRAVRAGVVPLHPANDSSRDQLLFRHLARKLSENGIAVLRFDRRAKNMGRDVPLSDQAEDAIAAIDELRDRIGAPQLPVGLWGWSQGAWAATVAAACSQSVNFLILAGCSGVSPAVQMRYGTSEQLRSAGYGTTDRARLVRLRRTYEAAVRGSISQEAAQRVIDVYAGYPWFKLAWVPRRLSGRIDWKDMDYDPSSSFEQITVPTLLFYGERDEWVPIGPSLRRWKAAQQVSRNQQVRVVRLRGTTHAPTIGGKMTAAAISPQYTQVLLDWLEARAFS